MIEEATSLVHATTISIDGKAVVIRGKSGTGKSDLALRLIETEGNGLSARKLRAVLVSDDQTLLRRRGERIFASAPEAIRGLLEVRGQGLIEVTSVQDVVVVLVVDLVAAAQIERLPEAGHLATVLLGVSLPAIAIDPDQPSAASRVRSAWERLGSFDKSP